MTWAEHKKQLEKEFPTRGLVILEDGKFSRSATLEMYHNALIHEGAKWMYDNIMNTDVNGTP